MSGLVEGILTTSILPAIRERGKDFKEQDIQHGTGDR
jgi:hypothetical protein